MYLLLHVKRKCIHDHVIFDICCDHNIPPTKLVRFPRIHWKSYEITNEYHLPKITVLVPKLQLRTESMVKFTVAQAIRVCSGSQISIFAQGLMP